MPWTSEAMASFMNVKHTVSGLAVEKEARRMCSHSVTPIHFAIAYRKHYNG